MKSPIVWFGGKGAQTQYIMPWIHGYKHAHYVEPFGGGASVLFAKRPSKIETYNDLDSALYDFFRVLADRELFADFERIVSVLPHSRQFHAEYKAAWESEEDLVRRVAMWFLVARQSFSGDVRTGWGNVAKKSGGTRVQKWLSAVNRLPEVHARLQCVQIENRDAMELIERFDDPGILFYCDPPYVWSTRKSGGYKHEMDDRDHVRLLELLTQRVAIVSGYDSDSYTILTDAGYVKHEYEMACASAMALGVGREMRTECLWLHPRVAKAKQPSLFARVPKASAR